MSELYYWTGVLFWLFCASIGFGAALCWMLDKLNAQYGFMKVIVSYWMNKQEFKNWQERNKGDA